ncbi:sulfurtransferase TusA [Endozoicomonas sp. 8E]|uniref:sulfurtransferase TusA n=1 Tax=Endozoicomonas sp. 8E TaxID=3035692 RepID=UPI0029392755|nr:sulfurtransferase TusA [Endozoicomonas sp. 8E]WOG29768.1 sulfurtransferase TusA [Endozoicomonas sp. 8E]
MSETIEINYELDTSGLLCPEPVMMLHNKVRDMKTGETVRVIATDPSTQRDIPKFCNFLDHELLSHEQLEKQYIYLIRKAGS